MLTSESLRLPASLLRRFAGAGRFAQLDGALFPSGVERCLRSVSKGDLAEVGVWGGPREEALLPDDWKADSLLGDLCCRSSSRSLDRPRPPGRSTSSSVRGLRGGLCLVFSAMNPRRMEGVTSRPGFAVSSCWSIVVSSVDMSWTPL